MWRRQWRAGLGRLEQFIFKWLFTLEQFLGEQFIIYGRLCGHTESVPLANHQQRWPCYSATAC